MFPYACEPVVLFPADKNSGILYGLYFKYFPLFLYAMMIITTVSTRNAASHKTAGNTLHRYITKNARSSPQSIFVTPSVWHHFARSSSSTRIFELIGV